ncbi:Hypothetical_protein [Hexamita inflata]|uniref:Hypothetical_protein n=1 Tax=Hexamita inflata TaxID=28002 RepID=A0AA86PK11_9EUKA|nr:Hypothetical protein HINF_LOCUS28925 [Hexamita inflata]
MNLDQTPFLGSLTQFSTDEIQINFLSSRKINFNRISYYHINKAGSATVNQSLKKLCYCNLQTEMMEQQSLFRFCSRVISCFGTLELQSYLVENQMSLRSDILVLLCVLNSVLLDQLVLKFYQKVKVKFYLVGGVNNFTDYYYYGHNQTQEYMDTIQF